jgi:hypothetical protein
MNFIFAKLFEQYKRKKNESPVFSITLYISIVYFFLLLAFLLPVSEVLKPLYFQENVKYNKDAVMLIIFSVFLLITYLVYNKYIKKRKINKLTIKYQDQKINKFMLYLLVIMMPVFLLILGGTITVLLKGGKILNWQIEGILN